MRKNLTMTLAVLALSTAIAVSGKPAMAETSPCQAWRVDGLRYQDQHRPRLRHERVQ